MFEGTLWGRLIDEEGFQKAMEGQQLRDASIELAFQLAFVVMSVKNSASGAAHPRC